MPCNHSRYLSCILIPLKILLGIIDSAFVLSWHLLLILIPNSEIAFAPKKLGKAVSVRQVQAEHIGKLVTVEGIGTFCYHLCVLLRVLY